MQDVACTAEGPPNRRQSRCLVEQPSNSDRRLGDQLSPTLEEVASATYSYGQVLQG